MEIRHAVQEKPCPSTSRILKLSPELDSHGILRAKARLQKAPVPLNTQQPIILPGNHPAVKLYLETVHKRSQHQGVEYIRSVVQQDFWILGIRSTLRAIKYRCLDCKRYSAKAETPPMADLSAERVAARVFPFTNVGVDYFGPFEVKLLRRSMKR